MKRSKESKFKKIQVVRQSRGPIEPEHIEAYQNEWREEFDKLDKSIGAHQEDHDKRDFESMNAQLEALRDRLVAKYPYIGEWDWITTQREWKEKTQHYGPIAVAYSAHGKLIYLICDEL